MCMRLPVSPFGLATHCEGLSRPIEMLGQESELHRCSVEPMRLRSGRLSPGFSVTSIPW